MKIKKIISNDLTKIKSSNDNSSTKTNRNVANFPRNHDKISTSSSKNKVYSKSMKRMSASNQGSKLRDEKYTNNVIKSIASSKDTILEKDKAITKINTKIQPDFKSPDNVDKSKLTNSTQQQNETILPMTTKVDMELYRDISPSDAPHSIQEFKIKDSLKNGLKEMGVSTFTPFQSSFFSETLENRNRNIIAISEAATGKSIAAITCACHHLLREEKDYEAGSILIVIPTRDQLHRTAKLVQVLSVTTGLTMVTLSGEEEIGKQRLNIERTRPTIILGTIGRISQLIPLGSVTPSNVKYLILEECDKLLGITFEKEVNSIISKTRSRNAAYLLSSSHSRKLRSLQKNVLGPQTKFIVFINEIQYVSVRAIEHKFIFVPEKLKHVYLSYILNNNPGKRIIVFANDNTTCIQLSIMLRSLGFITSPFTSNMKEGQRDKCLRKFKNGDTPVLLATDVVLRSLEIPKVELVIHYEVPIRTQDYSSRCCRIDALENDKSPKTSISILSQYDLATFQQIENDIEIKMTELEHNDEDVKYLINILDDAWKMAQRKAKDQTKIADISTDDRTADDAILALAKKRKRMDGKETSKKKNKESKKHKRRRF